MKNFDWSTFFLRLFYISIPIIIFGSIILDIYVLIAYGNTPINECPVWVWWILRLHGNGK